MFKKLLISFLLAIYLLTSLSVSHVKADANPWYNQGLEQWYTKVYGDNPQEIFGERYTAAQIDWIIWSVLTWLPTKIVGPKLITCALTGDFGECLEGIVSPDSGATQIPQQTAKTSNKSLLASIFEDRPLSGITYVKNLGRKFHLIPETKAQEEGFGFQKALMPIQGMWKASRNTAYTLFVLIAIILSFMIMFRVKISPQIVITVQSALPKLAIALILVTFSYAIAGFLIDLMYVVIGIISLLAKGFFPGDISSTVIFEFLTKGRFFQIDFELGIFGLFVLFLLFFTATFLSVTAALIGVVIPAIAGVLSIIGIAALFATGAIGGAAAVIFFIIILVILLIVLLVLIWMYIKTIWTLFKAYANILLLTIFAPFQIALGALIPAIGFGRWLKSFVSNLAVFVTVGFLFLLAFIFTTQGMVIALTEVAGKNFGSALWNSIFGVVWGDIIIRSTMWPPLLGVPGESGVALLFLGVGFIIFTIIPKSADLIKSLIEGQPFSYGAAIGESLKPAAWTGKAGALYGAGMAAEYLERTPPTIPSPQGPKPTGSRATVAGMLRRVTGTK